MSDLISTVKGFYAAFSRGDIATILASVADDVSWEYEATSEIPFRGIRRSRREVAEYFSTLATEASDHNLEMTEFFSTDDAVAAFGRYQGTMKSSGIRTDTPVAHYFKFRDGKVIRQIQLTNTLPLSKRSAAGRQAPFISHTVHWGHSLSCVRPAISPRRVRGNLRRLVR